MPNPVLEGYLKSVAIQHQQDQLKQERELAEQTLDLHHQQLDETKKQHDSDLKLRHILTKQAMTEQFNQMYGNNGDTSGLPQPQVSSGFNGSIPNENNSGAAVLNDTTPKVNSNQSYQMTPQQGFNGDLASTFPEGITIDPQYQNKQLGIQQKAGEAANKLAAEKQVAIEKEKRQTSTENNLQNHLLRSQENVQKGQDAKDVAKIHAGAQLGAANIQANSRLSAAKISASARMSGLDVNPDDIENEGQDIADGVVDFNKVPAKRRPLIQAWLHESGQSIPDKPAIDKGIANAKAVQQLMLDYRDAIQKYSAGGTEAPKANFVGRGINSIKGQTGAFDVGSTIAGLKSQGGALATLFDQQNRKSDAEIIRQVTGLLNPASDVKQNMKNWNEHMGTLNSRILSMFHGLPADQVNNLLTKNDIHLFGGAGQGVKGDVSAGVGSTLPKIGDVIKGHKYKGGDPADKSNWVKVTQ